jgi:MOSC domain-containing protein YiiM
MSHGTLLQINRSNGGMPKRAIEGPVAIGSLGVEGDVQRNTMVHGGPDQAVLMIASESIADLVANGFPVYAGALGENLTVSGLDPESWRAGQRYRVGGEVVIELTKLRKPCLNLDVYGPAIKAELLRGARGGYYARVIRTGFAVAGEAVTLESSVC